MSKGRQQEIRLLHLRLYMASLTNSCVRPAKWEQHNQVEPKELAALSRCVGGGNSQDQKQPGGFVSPPTCLWSEIGQLGICLKSKLCKHQEATLKAMANIPQAAILCHIVQGF